MDATSGVKRTRSDKEKEEACGGAGAGAGCGGGGGSGVDVSKFALLPLDEDEAQQVLTRFVPLAVAPYKLGVVTWGFAPQFTYAKALDYDQEWCMAQIQAQKKRPYACRAPFVAWLEERFAADDGALRVVDGEYVSAYHLAKMSALSRSFDIAPLTLAVTYPLGVAGDIDAADPDRITLMDFAYTLADLVVTHRLAHAWGGKDCDDVLDAALDFLNGDSYDDDGTLMVTPPSIDTMCNALYKTADTRTVLPQLTAVAVCKLAYNGARTTRVTDDDFLDTRLTKRVLPSAQVDALLDFIDTLDLGARSKFIDCKLAGRRVMWNVSWVVGTHAVLHQRWKSTHQQYDMRELLLFAAAMKVHAGIKLSHVTVLALHTATRTTIDLASWDGEEAMDAWAARKIVQVAQGRHGPTFSAHRLGW